MQIPAEITINQNAAECITRVEHWGFNSFHNICAKTVVDVPWGLGDWIGAVFAASFLTALMLILIGWGVTYLRDHSSDAY